MSKIKKTSYKPKWEVQINHNYTADELKQLADQMLEWVSAENDGKNMNFWLNDFAASKKLLLSQLTAFAARSPYFATIYQICKSIQESKLLKMALYKEVNATPAVFILKSIIGTGENGIPQDMDSAKKQIEEMFE
jgi:hypothetical protein